MTALPHIKIEYSDSYDWWWEEEDQDGDEDDDDDDDDGDDDDDDQEEDEEEDEDEGEEGYETMYTAEDIASPFPPRPSTFGSLAKPVALNTHIRFVDVDEDED